MSLCTNDRNLEPHFPHDVWLHHILPFLDGVSLFQLSICSKVHYQELIVRNGYSHEDIQKKENDHDKNYDDTLPYMGRITWENCCRKRWRTVQDFHRRLEEREDHFRNRIPSWYKTYKRMHLQDKKLERVLSLLVIHRIQTESSSDHVCFELLFQVLLSNTLDQLFDGLIDKCNSLMDIMSSSSNMTRYQNEEYSTAVILLLEVNQVVSMRRLCQIVTTHDSVTTPSSFVEQGAILITQLCQTIPELIHHKSLYAIESEINSQLDGMASLLRYRLDCRLANYRRQKHVQCKDMRQSEGELTKDSEFPIEWILEEMKTFFSNQKFQSGSNDTPTNDPINMGSTSTNSTLITFTGNSDRYYDWHNSLLDKVLQKRTGIPITLCIIYASIVRRSTGIIFNLIGIPSHVLLSYPISLNENHRHSKDDLTRSLFIDAFDGGRVCTISHVQAMVENFGTPWSDAYLTPMPNGIIWRRMMANIIHTSKDYQSSSSGTLLNVIKRRLDVTIYPPSDESEANRIMLRFVHLSPLCFHHLNQNDLVGKFRAPTI